MNVLITGSNGQLGSEIRFISQFYNYNFFFENANSLDVTNFIVISNYIKSNKINIVINCAAYTNVDQAELNQKICYNVNVLGVKNLTLACEEFNCKLIHISTDYIFDGKHISPISESSNPNPIGVYAQTKHSGERAIMNSSVTSLIIRTSWLYSTFGNNFVKTMINLSKKKRSINVVSDQIGTPTYARDLAYVCLNFVKNKLFKNTETIVCNYTNEGFTSWDVFARTIFKFANIDCKVIPISSNEYPTKAKRPYYTVLDKSKIKKLLKMEIPLWKKSLYVCIKLLNND